MAAALIVLPSSSNEFSNYSALGKQCVPRGSLLLPNHNKLFEAAQCSFLTPHRCRHQLSS